MKHYLNNQIALDSTDQIHHLSNLNPNMFVRGVEVLKEQGAEQGFVKEHQVDELERILKTYLDVVQGLQKKAIKIESLKHAQYLKGEEEKANALETVVE